jgi:protein-S-isoprenylcysteine O-methyltransferase
MNTAERTRPIIWHNGEAQREYEYTKQLLQFADLPPQLARTLERKMKGAMEDNVYDYSVFAGFGLGLFFMFGLSLFFHTTWTALGIHIAALSLYHLLEYTYVWRFHPKDCGFNCTSFLRLFLCSLPSSHFLLAFLFSPNEHYQLAMAVSFLEYLVEGYFFPSWKDNTFFIVIGTLGIIVGQIFRTGAMWTAGSNFHHLVREARENDHVLVTSGIYGYVNPLLSSLFLSYSS